MMHRPPRRHRRRSAAVTMLLAAPVLASCGFSYQTDEVNTISAGINDRDETTNILGAVIVADRNDAGVFGASLTNDRRPTASDIAAGDLGDDALVGLSSGTIEEPGLVEPLGEVGPYEVEPAGLVNLFEEGGVPVVGDFAAGQFVEISLSFESGQVSTIEVPVVPACFQYDIEGLEFPAAGVGDVYEELDPDTPDEPNALVESEDSALYDCTTLEPVNDYSGEEAEEAESEEGEE